MDVEAELKPIFRNLNEYFKKYKVVSQDEIAAAVSSEVAKLTKDVRQSLETGLKGDLQQVLVDSIVSAPISVYSPNLTSKRNYLGEVFYHYPTHDFLAEDLGQAFERLVKLRALASTAKIEETLGAFLQKSGYDTTARSSTTEVSSVREMTATKGSRQLEILMLPSVNSIPDHASSLEEGKQYVMVVPTENTPAPFISFCQQQATEFEGKKAEIWVVDIEKRVVNPFLGYTHDDDIFHNFDNPHLASFACRMYGVGKDLWVRSR